MFPGTCPNACYAAASPWHVVSLTKGEDFPLHLTEYSRETAENAYENPPSHRQFNTVRVYPGCLSDSTHVQQRESPTAKHIVRRK